MRDADVFVDVRAVGVVRHEGDAAAPFGEERADVGRGRAVRRVYYYWVRAVLDVAEELSETLNVSSAVFGAVAHGADTFGRGAAAAFVVEEYFLDAGFVVVGELEAVAIEELYTVVFRRVVRSADDRAAAERPAQGRAAYAGRRYDAEVYRVAAGRSYAGHERGLEHFAGESGVAPNRYFGALDAVFHEEDGVCGAEAHRGVGRHHALVRYVAYSVGTKELPFLSFRFVQKGHLAEQNLYSIRCLFYSTEVTETCSGSVLTTWKPGLRPRTSTGSSVCCETMFDTST